MNVKIFCLLLITFVLTGCSVKEAEPITVYYPVEVLTPIQCKVPEVQCNYMDKTLSRLGVIRELYLCVQTQREAMKVCK